VINIKIDSRKIKPGDTFVAIKGATVNGHDYIDKAIELGATKIVMDEDRPCSVEKLLVKDSNEWLTEYISNTYSKEVNEMNIIGITGTNGKTTTAYLTYQLLNELGTKTAYIGTIGFYIPNEEIIELPNTTPNILDLYELLLQAKDKQCKNIIMEVSSHALDQKRVQGINFSLGGFTNFTQDHLDYHKTMENYLNAKLLLLKQLKGKLIVNNDDSYAKEWTNRYDNYETLGFNGDNYKIISYEDIPKGTLIKVIIDDKEYNIETNLKSKFNIYNYLFALSFSKNLGFSIEEIIKATTNIYPPRGRCEQIHVRNGMAIIDYAHTPDAVEKIITSFNKDNTVITIIGCGGDRDTKKRPIMGKIATENSNYVIFTSDNPRTEDPHKILEDIISGVTLNNYEIIPDRKEAIIKGLDMIKNKEIVLLLGKGHEDYQIIGHDKIHLDDKEEVEKYLNSHK
jgi:UDP-N-acetylmuramoyl-L-alanyl-D-glutamate--2,6-diaminopimelate ligase